MINTSEIIRNLLIDSSAKSFVIFLTIVLGLLGFRLLRDNRYTRNARNTHIGPDHVHAIHRVWVFMIVSMLMLPILSFALPSLSIPLPFLNTENSFEKTTSLSALSQRKPVVDSNQDRASPEKVSKNKLDMSTKDQLSARSDFDLSSSTSSPAPISGAANTFQSEPLTSNLAAPSAKALQSTNWTLIFAALWAIVCLALLMRIALAKFWTQRLLNRSMRIDSEDLSLNIGAASLVESTEIDSPAVSGLLSHTIILPAHWRDWNDEKREAVIAHELAHIRRRDGLVVFLAQVNSALFWFNPIAWIAKSKVNRLAELACDQQAALETGDRLLYAQQLLEIAAAKMGHRFQPGIAMAAPNGISERIEMLLDTTRPFTRKASRVFVSTLLLVGIPTLMVIAAAQPGDEDRLTGAEKAAEDWIRTENGKTILTFRGEVVLEDGTPADNPRVRARTSDWLEVSVDNNEFEFDIELKNWHRGGLRILAESEEGKLAAITQYYSHDMRVAASKFHSLKLMPTKSIDFEVLDEGNPVSGANVAANSTDRFTAEGVTNEDGIVTLNFPLDSMLDETLAWCDDGRIGGYSFGCNPVRDPKLPLHKIEVSSCIDQKIRLVESATGKPLAGFKFQSHIIKPDYSYLPRDLVNEMPDLITDENGEATDRWFPDWKSVHFYPDLEHEFEYGQGWSKAGDGKAKLVDGVFVCEFEQPPSLQRLPFKGQLMLPEDVKGGLEIRLTSYQHPQEGRYDPITCRSDIEGNFTADVIQGATYSIAVNDPVWASEAWAGILAGPGSKKTPSPKIKIFKGEPISVTVTAGPNNSPLKNTIVAFSSKYCFEWTEDESTQSGSDSLQWWATTDEHGVARTTAAPGKFSTHIYNPEWRPNQEFEIVKGKPTELVFHRASPGKRMIHGQLSHTNPKADFSGTVVELRSIDGATKSETTVETDASGRFSAEMNGALLGGFAKTSDGRHASSFFIREISDKVHKVAMKPAVSYRGKVVDGNDKPIADQQLHLKVILRDKERNKFARFVSSQFEVDDLVATTDSDGMFEFLAPIGMPCRLYYRTTPATDRDSGLRRYGSRNFLAGEDRPLDIVKIGAAPVPKYPAEHTVSWKVKDCKLSHTRHLFVLEGEGDSVAAFLKSALNEGSKDGRAFYWYCVTRLSTSELQEPDWKKLWETYPAQLPGENEATFFVMGHEKEQIDAITLNAKAKDSKSKLLEFVRANRIEKIDAQKTLDEAFAVAKSTDRKVWLQFSQTRCGPCFMLSRWIDKHKDVLEKAYVFIKVDNLRDENGQDIWKRYVGERSMGIPFCVVLDAEGNVVEETLDLEKSNIGFPSTFEDSRGFRRIFDATAKGKLTEEEIDALIKSIE